MNTKSYDFGWKHKGSAGGRGQECVSRGPGPAARGRSQAPSPCSHPEVTGQSFDSCSVLSTHTHVCDRWGHCPGHTSQTHPDSHAVCLVSRKRTCALGPTKPGCTPPARPAGVRTRSREQGGGAVSGRTGTWDGRGPRLRLAGKSWGPALLPREGTRVSPLAEDGAKSLGGPFRSLL